MCDYTSASPSSSFCSSLAGAGQSCARAGADPKEGERAGTPSRDPSLSFPFGQDTEEEEEENCILSMEPFQITSPCLSLYDIASHFFLFPLFEMERGREGGIKYPFFF